MYERQYQNYMKKQNDLESEKQKLREYKLSKELESCTFKPQINNLSKEVFESKFTEKEAKVYEQTIERMRNGILENFKKKYLAEK